MNSESLLGSWRNPALRDESPSGQHPSGEIRLPGRSPVGSRARLLAGLTAASGDDSSVIETLYTVSYG
ncbi:hypothetical protein ACIRPK_33980 [Kitasatospora sp. NPDC101801]|uniref:hypothetical protein n=1 Tax=Kitasatospora sp. NPDC101801 TaxID=3364103 RepID=UPI00380641A3